MRTFMHQYCTEVETNKKKKKKKKSGFSNGRLLEVHEIFHSAMFWREKFISSHGGKKVNYNEKNGRGIRQKKRKRKIGEKKEKENRTVVLKKILLKSQSFT